MIGSCATTTAACSWSGRVGSPPARSTVLVYEDIDGQLEIRYRDRVMRWTEVAGAAVRVGAAARRRTPPAADAAAARRRRAPWRDHPWRTAVDEYLDRAAAREGSASVGGA